MSGPWDQFAAATPSPAGPWTAFAEPVGREDKGAWDALVAGYQSSATGLLVRGKLPDVILDPHHAKWYESVLSTASSIVADLPEAIAGTVAGSAIGAAVGGAAGSAVPVVGNVVGAAGGAIFCGGAGMMAGPAEIRQSLMRAYQNGDAASSVDWLDRARIILPGLGGKEVMKATGKAAVVGAATLGAGRVAAPLGAMAKFGAELGTVTVAP